MSDKQPAEARSNKARELLAKLRARQLSAAVQGRVIESARYASLAMRVRRSKAPMAA